jgi:hypothetical protein
MTGEKARERPVIALSAFLPDEPPRAEHTNRRERGAGYVTGETAS